jgi:hypothetical protein
MKDKLERREATGNSRNMIVPSVPSLRLVPVVPIRFSRSIAAPVQAVIWRTADQGSMFNVNVESVKAVLGKQGAASWSRAP